jgi:hypothetical protein
VPLEEASRGWPFEEDEVRPTLNQFTPINALPNKHINVTTHDNDSSEGRLTSGFKYSNSRLFPRTVSAKPSPSSTGNVAMVTAKHPTAASRLKAEIESHKRIVSLPQNIHNDRRSQVENFINQTIAELYDQKGQKWSEVVDHLDRAEGLAVRSKDVEGGGDLDMGGVDSHVKEASSNMQMSVHGRLEHDQFNDDEKSRQVFSAVRGLGGTSFSHAHPKGMPDTVPVLSTTLADGKHAPRRAVAVVATEDDTVADTDTNDDTTRDTTGTDMDEGKDITAVGPNGPRLHTSASMYSRYLSYKHAKHVLDRLGEKREAAEERRKRIGKSPHAKKHSAEWDTVLDFKLVEAYKQVGEEFWSKVASKLAEHGKVRTAEQCEARFAQL